MEGGDQELRKKVQVALRRQIKKIEVAGNIFCLTYVDGSVSMADFLWTGWEADIEPVRPYLDAIVDERGGWMKR
jgi:hypothetical protein